VLLTLLGALTTLFLPILPVLAGGLLAAGGALAGWAGWRAGGLQRPRPLPVPVPVEDRPRRPRRP
jgi:hypothetical protein